MNAKRPKNRTYHKFVTDPITERKCRECQCFLPASRYFKCYQCEPKLKSIDEDFMYTENATQWTSEDEEIIPEDLAVWSEEDLQEIED
jgi:hypothetical protein